MNKLKKIGLTALAGSLVATSVFAGTMDVTGGASITFAGQDKTSAGNGWTMNDEITFAGSGELDNGMTMSISMQLDNNAVAATGNTMDNRSLSLDMADAGKITFYGHGADSALSAVDDVMPRAGGNEAWDTIGASSGGTAKFGSIGGHTVNNMMHYSNNTAMEGLAFNASYAPGTSATTVAGGDGGAEGTTSFAVAYTGVEGLTVGYAMDENGALGTAAVDYDTMYIKYAMGPVTVGYQKSESDGSLSTLADDDEFQAIGVSYAVSEELSVSYEQSSYDDGAQTTDQENTLFGASYSMGSMALSVSIVSMDNVGGSTDAIDDVQGYELGLSFAF
jgi:outer membrane protein OmpU